MTILRCLLLLFLLPLPVCALAAEPQQRVAAAARISAVTVYPDRALTTRTAAVNLQPGSYLVAFEGLPPLIEDDSVRVAGKGSAGATIVGLEVRRIFLDRSNEARVKTIEEEIRALERRAATLAAKKSGLAAQGEFLQSIRVAWGERLSRELATGRPAVAELQEAAAFVGTGVARIEEESVAIETEKRELKEKIDALRRQQNEATGSRRKEVKNVEVLVEVTRAGTLTLDLTAVLPQAGWVPAYDVRLAADGKTAEFTFRALVRQQTGEDWSGVDLTLSTARPATGAAPPELYPWRIDIFRPQPRQEMKAMVYPQAAPAPARGYEADLAEEVLDARAAAAVATAEIRDEATAIAFRIPRPVDIPADGSQHGSIVALEELPVRLEYLATPKFSPYVFRRSEIVNTFDYPLLPGKVSTYAGNIYTGSTQLEKVAAGETFDLFFGADEQITVKHRELKQHKEAGMFGRNRISLRYAVEIGNFRSQPVTVTLRDLFPLAGDEEIKVSLEEPTIRPDEIDEEGKMTWKLPLAAGEKKELAFGIVVEYPKERQITGL